MTSSDDILKNIREAARILKQIKDEEARGLVRLAEAGYRIMPSAMLPDRRITVMVPEDTYARFKQLVQEAGDGGL